MRYLFAHIISVIACSIASSGEFQSDREFSPINDFSINLLKNQLSLEQENTTLSTLSAANTLAILHAISGPPVKAQIERVLKSPDRVIPIIPNIKSRQPEGKAFYKQPEYAWAFRSADAIFSGSPHLLEPKVQDYRNSMLYVKTDFTSPSKAYQAINKWVDSHTEFYIRNFLGELSIPPKAKRLIINAVSLKGSWAYPFAPQNTHPKKFYGNERTIQIPMMTQNQVPIACHMEKSGLVSIGLDYGSPQSSADALVELVLIVIMPGKDTTLSDFIQNMTHEKLRAVIPRDIVEVNLEFPRFKSSGKTISLKPVFEKMGITGIFSQKNEDTSIEDETSLVRFDDIFHQSFLSISETGTEPTTRTDDQSMEDENGFSIASELPTIQVNRPFMWLIYDMKNRCIVFIGAQFTPHPN